MRRNISERPTTTTLQRLLDFLAKHADESSWPVNTLRARLVYGGDDMFEFQNAIDTLVARGITTLHEGKRGAMHLRRVEQVPEPRLFIAVAVLAEQVGTLVMIGEARVFTFVVPHADVDEDAILQQVAMELNVAGSAVADDDRVPEAWTPARLREAFATRVVVGRAAAFIVGERPEDADTYEEFFARSDR